MGNCFGVGGDAPVQPPITQVIYVPSVTPAYAPPSVRSVAVASAPVLPPPLPPLPPLPPYPVTQARYVASYHI